MLPEIVIAAIGVVLGIVVLVLYSVLSTSISNSQEINRLYARLEWLESSHQGLVSGYTKTRQEMSVLNKGRKKHATKKRA